MYRDKLKTLWIIVFLLAIFILYGIAGTNDFNNEVGEKVGKTDTVFYSDGTSHISG